MIGDLRSVALGLYKATLLNDYDVELEIPSCVSSFLQDYHEIKAAQVEWGNLNAAAEKAHTSARASIMNVDENQGLKILLRFRTGETLTNIVYTPTSVPIGEIQPEFTPYQTRFEVFGHEYQTTEAWMSWKVSRVEKHKRMAAVDASVGGANKVADLFARGVSIHGDQGEDDDNGMHVGS